MRSDRHGRLRQPDNDPRRRPPAGFRTPTPRRFRRLLDDAVAELPRQALDALTSATLEVVDVPGAGRDLEGPDPFVAVAESPDGVAVRRLVVHRRVAELHATDREDLVDLLRESVLLAVADALGADPDDWDPR